MGDNGLMANPLSAELMAQIYGQESTDPLLTLVTLTHASFSAIRLVNNTADIISNGNTFTAFPMKIGMPRDDGETSREVAIEFDNINLDLISAIRTVTTQIDVTIELVLASIPDAVQMSFNELKISNVTYNKSRVTARLYLDAFLNTELSSEKYLPLNFPGLF